MSNVVIGLMGLPGAGKTTAVNQLDSRIDYDFLPLQMSTVANNVFQDMENNGIDVFPRDMQEEFYDKNMISEVVLDEATMDKLGDWVDAVLKVNNEFFANKAIEYADELEEEFDFLVVDGIRSESDVSYFRKSAEELYLVYIHTPFHIRLERLQSRGREGEEEITAEQLYKRDKQELGWGVDEILKHEEVSYFYNSYSSIGAFSYPFDVHIESQIDDEYL